MTGIVLELQRDAMDSRVSLGDLLRKAKVVASKLDLRDALTWIDAETNGYPEGTTVPERRFIRGVVQARNPYQGYIPVEFPDRDTRALAESVALRQPIAELQALANTPSKQGLRVEGTEMARILGSELPLSIVLTTAMLQGVLDGVRNLVLEWALQLERDGVLGEGLRFSEREKASAAGSTATTIFNGPVGNAAVHSPHSTQHLHEPAAVDLARLLRELDALRAAVEDSEMEPDDKEEAVVVISAASSEAKKPEPRLKKVASAITLVKDSAQGAIAVQLIIKSILDALAPLLL